MSRWRITAAVALVTAFTVALGVLLYVEGTLLLFLSACVVAIPLAWAVISIIEWTVEHR